MPTFSSSCDRAVARGARVPTPAMPAQRLGQLRADRVGRIERGHRLLEDHRHARCRADRPWRARAAAADRCRRRRSLCAVAPRRLRQQAHQRERGQRLAAAGFADDAQHLAALDRETHVAHRMQQARRERDADVEMLDFEQRAHSAVLRRGDVAQPVAEQVDRQHQHEQRDARDGDHPRAEEHVLLALRDHQAPGRRRRRHAEAEERQRRFEQDSAAPSRAWRRR